MRRSGLKALLAERGIKVGWFATTILGMKRQIFDHVEAGRMRPPQGYYERAAAFFQMPLHEFLERIGREPVVESVA